MNSKFDILLAQVNGLTRMRDNFKYTYNQKITKIIEDQLDQGIDRFDKMDEIYKDEICAYFTQRKGSDRFDAIVQIDDLDGIVGDLLHYMSNYSSTAAHALADAMRQGLWQQFEDDINELFEQIAHERDCDRKREAGLSPHVDPINGEINWY